MFSADNRVLVVGDAMVDRYYEGEASRISPEAPVPVLRVRRVFDRPGGAANVALNLATLGVPVTLLCYVGDDADARALADALDGRGVDCRFVTARQACTVVKLRALSQRQQMIRLDFEDDFAAEDHGALLDAYRDLLGGHALVVLSDYAKGTLAEVAPMIALARGAGRPVLVDPKGTDFARYAGATILTPNQREFVAVAGACPDDTTLVDRGRAMCRTLGLDHLLVTRGERGMTLVDAAGTVTNVAAQAREVYDVTGAGDTALATLAAGIASGWSIVEAMRIANHAAGIVVSRKGTITVTAVELAASLTQPGIAMSDDWLIAEVSAARERGQRIVMTNGCFDILHAGHADYLARARALGDRLIVAVNSDASVRRLKGADRPFNVLADRIEVLGALRAVDWVVAFDGSVTVDGNLSDTPLDLIERVRPDVLVKGGDYRAEDVVGEREVRSWGGTVEILPFVAGRSTTALATKIRLAADERDDGGTG